MIHLYNSLTQKKELFVPINDNHVKFYVCGPTVYDRGHLGHGRSAVAFDVIRRFFIYSGYEVTFAMNITDIDDKMIKRANEEGISVKELADRITPLYLEDYGKLGVMKPDFLPFATEFVEDMILFISDLEKKGHTYVLDDGVYFDISTFPKYGELSHQNLEELKMGARIDVKDSKRNMQDFVLWKFSKPEEPKWGSPWGDGRPGWHIECSVMCNSTLGEKFDIHGGGLDLKFPHHECEIAQSKSLFGDDSFAKYWLHNGFINVDQEKMSKSLNNFFLLDDVFNKFDPQAVRMFYLSSHYRSPVNFSTESLNHSKSSLNRLHDFVSKLENGEFPDNNEVNFDFAKTEDDFIRYMEDDFNTSGALSVVFDVVKQFNIYISESSLNKTMAENCLNFFKKIDFVLGVIFPVTSRKLTTEMEDLIKEREEARTNRDFNKSDEIRDKLNEMGVMVEDTPKGTTWKFID